MSQKRTKNKEKIPTAVRNAVWSKYIGKDKRQDTCYQCGLEPITCANFHCGHIISEKNGGDISLDNLRPVCASCNTSTGTKNMKEFVIKHKFTDSKMFKEINGESSEPREQILEKLKLDELKEICEFYNLSKNGNKKSIIERIKSNNKFDYNDYILSSLKNMNVDTLKSICDDLNLTKRGTKNELIKRITESNSQINISDYNCSDSEDDIENQVYIPFNNFYINRF